MAGEEEEGEECKRELVFPFFGFLGGLHVIRACR